MRIYQYRSDYQSMNRNHSGPFRGAKSYEKAGPNPSTPNGLL